MKKVRIVSEGTAITTRVLDANGDPIKWGRTLLTKIEFGPIEPGGFVTATLALSYIDLDVDTYVRDGTIAAPE